MTKPCPCSYGKKLLAILGKGKVFQIKIMFHLFFRSELTGGGEGSKEAKIKIYSATSQITQTFPKLEAWSEALESLRNTLLKTTPTEQCSPSITKRHVSKPGHCPDVFFIITSMGGVGRGCSDRIFTLLTFFRAVLPSLIFALL